MISMDVSAVYFAVSFAMLFKRRPTLYMGGMQRYDVVIPVSYTHLTLPTIYSV